MIHPQYVHPHEQTIYTKVLLVLGLVLLSTAIAM